MSRSYYVAALGLSLAAVLVAGCGGEYEKRLTKRVGEMKAGTGAVGVIGQAPGSIDPKLHNAPFDITDINRVATGVRIHLPKQFFKADGTPDFVLSPAPAEFASLTGGTVMAHFYTDAAANKKYGALIIMLRKTPGVADDAARQTMLNNYIASLPDPKPAFQDFVTPNGKWHKLTYQSQGTVRVDSMQGATEQVPVQNDIYIRGTTNEVVLFHIVAPTAVANTFDFFGAAEAAMKILQAGPPTITGS